MDIISNILNVMNEKQVTASKLVSDLGIAKNAVSEWKSGRIKPSIELIIKLSEYFSTSTDYLLTGKQPLQEPDAHTDETLSRDEQKLLNQYRLMNNQGKEYILQTLDMAKERYKKDFSVPDMEIGNIS